MKILGVIPARGGSKGVPNKNIKLLNGKPLISYTIEAAVKSQLDRVIVSTDCKKISEISKKYGAEVLIRPKKLAKDDTPTLPVIQDVLSRSKGNYDAVMTLQPTSPIRSEKNINEAISIFEQDKKADSLVSVTRVPHNFMPEKIMKLNKGYLIGDSKPIRRQEMEVMYARNGASIYITKTEKLSEYIFGGYQVPYLMNKINSFDIDDLEDWDLVEMLMEKLDDRFV